MYFEHTIGGINCLSVDKLDNMPSAHGGLETYRMCLASIWRVHIVPCWYFHQRPNSDRDSLTRASTLFEKGARLVLRV
jgi:hypothetical protein